VIYWVDEPVHTIYYRYRFPSEIINRCVWRQQYLFISM